MWHGHSSALTGAESIKIMKLLIRLATAAVFFVSLFVVVYFGICIVGAGISGGIAGAHDPQHAAQAGRLAGENFVRSNYAMILLGSCGISLAASFALSFSGVLPWCRKSE
jgi:hypothetical protein